MTYEEYWNKLNSKKKVDGPVRLSPDQFKKMLKQAYDIGYSQGAESTRKIHDMMNSYSKSKSGIFEDLDDETQVDFLSKIMGMGDEKYE